MVTGSYVYLVSYFYLIQLFIYFCVFNDAVSSSEDTMWISE
jgi:hypothetical protein